MHNLNTSKSRKMKIVFIFGTYPPMKDGGADFLYNLSKNILKYNVEAYVLTTDKVSEYYKCVETWPKILPIINKWNSISDLIKTRNCIFDINPDIIHLIYPSSYFGNDYKIPFIIKVITRKPLITTFFSLFKTGSTLITKLGTLSVILSSDIITSHDYAYVKFFKKYFPFKKGRTYFVPVGNNIMINDISVSKKNCNALNNFGDDNIYISFNGQIDISKGIETLLNALKIVISKGYNKIRLIMVGSGDFERMLDEQIYNKDFLQYGQNILKLQSKLDLDKYVIWTPYLSAQDYYDYIRSSHFCVLPFRKNTLGRSSLICALSLGKAVITTGGDPYLKDGENALIVPPDSPDLLAAAIIRMITLPGLRKRLETQSLEIAKEFSWDKIADDIYYLYKSMLS